MLAKKRKRTLALLLSTVMILGLLPVSAFAASDSTRQQIVNAGGTNYYSNTGKQQDKKNDSTAVEVTKKVSPHKDGAENHFTIDLSVTTNQHVEEIHYSEDSAVVLVLDVSGSMGTNNPCPECGRESLHKIKCSFYGTGIFPNRLSDAKAAALSFLEAYHDSATVQDGTRPAARYVSIMEFEDDGERVLAWVDAATDDGYTKARNAIAGITESDDDTNIEAGLLLARNNLNILPKVDGKEIESRYVVLLTDGEANEHSKGDQDTELTSPKELNDDGEGGDHVGWAEKAAMRVKGTAGPGAYQDRAILYTVACGEAKAGWLRDSIASSPQTALSAGNTEELNAAFTIISNNIEIWAEAWVVTDPMGANIAFDTATGADGSIHNTSAKFDADTGTLSWDLKKAKPTGAAHDGSSFTYTLSYDIILDTTGIEGGNGAAYPTNGNTTLTYVMVNGQGAPTSDPSKPYTATFDIPTVKGQAGAFLFKKVSQETRGQDKKDHKPLEGATFTLTHDENCACGLDTPAEDEWAATSNEGGVVHFKGVPSGHTYTLQETAAPAGYALDSKEYKVAAAWGDVKVDGEKWAANKKLVYNTLDPKAVTVTVTKTWQDTAAPEQRPDVDEFTVTLTGNDAGESTYTVTNWQEKGAVWTGTVEVPTVDVTNGQPISYDVTESAVDGYAPADSNSSAVVWALDNAGKPVSGSAALTNTLHDTVPVTVTKKWFAPVSMIPDTLKVTLSAGDKSYDLTLKASEGWTAKVDVDLYAGGNKLDYSVSETTTGLDSRLADPIYLGDMDKGFTILNAVEQETLTISGNKTWVGEKPGEDQKITVTLTGDNGESYETDLTNGNTSFQFTGVPKYDLEPVYATDGKTIIDYTGTGKEIVYTVSDEVDGFTKATATVSSDGTATLNNVVEQEPQDITVAKRWIDGSNAGGTRPGSVTIELWRTVAGVDGFEPEKVNGITFSAEEIEDPNWEAPEDDPDAKAPMVTRWTDDDYFHTFEGVDTYYLPADLTADGAGSPYTYFVHETGVTDGTITGQKDAEYRVAYCKSQDLTDMGEIIDALVVTNTLDNESVTTMIPVTKVWKDPFVGNASQRSASAVVTITASDGTTYPVTFDGSMDVETVHRVVPVYGADYQELTFTAEETTVPTGYTSAQETVENGFKFVNTIAQTQRDITVTKVWEDSFTNISSRPNIELKLYRDGNKDAIAASVTGANMTKLDGDTYEHTFTVDTYNLQTGKEITYNVLESVTGNNAGRFFPSFAGNMTDGFTVTNSFAAGETSVSGSKVWVRPASVELPDSVTIAVYGADKETPVDSKAIEAGEDGKWTYSFTGLPKYDAADGSLIDYTVGELDVPVGWTSSVSAQDKRTITNTSDVLNDTVEYTVTKKWVGPESDRPDELVVVVYRDGETEPVAEYPLVAKDGWAHTFTLPKYHGTELAVYSAKERDSKADLDSGKLLIQGKALTYEVTSTSTDYRTDFTNTVIQDNTVTVAGEKIWDGAPVAFTAPEITVELWADNVKTQKEQTVGETAEDGTRDWTFSFGTLPKYAVESDGHEIVNTVREKDATAGSALFVQNGTYYYFNVTGGAEIAEGDRAGYYDLTNTYSRTEVYSYKVVGEYTVNIDDKSAGSVRMDLEPEKNAGKGANISRSAEDAAQHTTPVFPENSALKDYSGKEFTYNEKDSKTSVKLEKAGEVYEIVLKYTYDLTTTSYTVNHEYYVDGNKQDYLEGDTYTYNQGVYVGDVVSANSIQARENRGGLKYTLTDRTPGSLTLDADDTKNVFTFTYHYTTPPTPTYTLTVNHVDHEGNEAHKDIFKDGQPVTHKITETASASPLTAESGLPTGYKLVKTSGDVEGKVSFNEKGIATVNGEDGDNIIITYSYGSENTVLITINYLMNNEERTPITELPKQELTNYKSYDSYDVTALILKPAAGAHGQYTYVTDSTKSETNPDGVYAGTLGTENLTIDVLYDVESYPYKVVFHNDYNNTVIATVSNDQMMAEYGATLTDEDLRVWFPGQQDWVNAHRPSGYNAGTVTYPASIGYSPVGVFNDDPAGGAPIWDHSPITNIVHVHYGYSSSSGGGGGDSDPSYRITVNYLEDESGEVLAPRYRTRYLTRGSSYDVTEQTTEKVINGFDFVRTEGADITGQITRNLTIDVYYTPVVNIPDNPIPEGGQPDEPVTPPPADGGKVPGGGDVDIPGGDNVDIPDGDVPMGDGGGIPGQNGGSGTDTGTGLDDGGTTIVDDRPPMGDLPQTGTLSTPVDPTATLAYLTLAASMAAAGLAFATGRKKDEEEA